MARRRAVTPLHEVDERGAPLVDVTDVQRTPLVDPRDGDIEADASSTESRSLLAIAGNLLAEVSLPKFAVALVLLVVLPALLLGSAPLLATMWWNKFSSTGVGGIGAIVFLVFLLAVAWFGGRKLFRLAESSFWSLNAMAIQPAYVAFREGLLHASGRMTREGTTQERQARVRALASVLSGLVLCALSVFVIWLVWSSENGLMLLDGW